MYILIAKATANFKKKDGSFYNYYQGGGGNLNLPRVTQTPSLKSKEK